MICFLFTSVKSDCDKKNCISSHLLSISMINVDTLSVCLIDFNVTCSLARTVNRVRVSLYKFGTIFQNLAFLFYTICN